MIIIINNYFIFVYTSASAADIDKCENGKSI